MILNRDFKEFIQSLNENDVKYLVIGGYAVALHGHPRYTKDIDIWVRGDIANAQKILKALEQFGFGSLNITKEDFQDPEQVIQLGRPPRRIDLLNDLTGLNFDECYPSRIHVQIDNITATFIDLDNLVKSKKASGRHSDLADLEKLGK